MQLIAGKDRHDRQPLLPNKIAAIRMEQKSAFLEETTPSPTQNSGNPNGAKIIILQVDNPPHKSGNSNRPKSAFCK